jgi:hypothetical protein
VYVQRDGEDQTTAQAFFVAHPGEASSPRSSL